MVVLVLGYALVYHFPLGISNHNKTDVKKCSCYDETVNNDIKVWYR